MAPREFDFPDFKVNPLQHYIGFKKSKDPYRFQDDVYDSISKTILMRKQSEGRKLVYCAFGSTELNQFTTVLNFLNKLIMVTARLKQLLIISIRLPEDIGHKLCTAEHVYVFKIVPQQEVLSYSDLFVTHGGLSSIKESIDAGVPMLMYPVHKTYDVNGNSARVVYHGMGLRGDALADTEKEIEEKVVALLSNSTYREKLEDMKRKNLVYTDTIFLKTFSELSAVD
jgi:zeaxanthin glucosyltransferase